MSKVIKKILWLTLWLSVIVLLLPFRVKAEVLPECTPWAECVIPDSVPVTGGFRCVAPTNNTVYKCCPINQTLNQTTLACEPFTGLPTCVGDYLLPSSTSVTGGIICLTPDTGQPAKGCGANQTLDRTTLVCESATITPIEDGVTAETFDALNPLKQVSEGVEEDLSSPGGILTRVLRFAFPIAGFILFIMLIWAGFEIVSGATTGQKSLDAGKQRATAAIIGFILLFISYFIAQLLQVIFGIVIL